VLTPTLDVALAVADAGADVVAIDGTGRPRPDGRTLASVVADFKARRPGCLVMADVSTYDEGIAAADASADLVGTTLAGHTDYSYRGDGPDFDTLERLAADLGVPILAEGRIHTPALAPKRFASARTAWWSAPRSPIRARSRHGSSTHSHRRSDHRAARSRQASTARSTSSPIRSALIAAAAFTPAAAAPIT